MYFDTDLKTFELLDYDQYWVDLNLAIQTGNATWKKDHSALEYYSLSDMRASSWDKLARSWLSGDDNMTTWRNYVERSHDHDPVESVNRVKEACSALTVTSADDCKDRVLLSSSSSPRLPQKQRIELWYQTYSHDNNDDDAEFSGLWMLNMFIELAKKLF